MLLLLQRSHCVVCVHHRLRPHHVECTSGQVDAPVVHRDGQVEQAKRTTGEVKVDQPANRLAGAVFYHQHVVAEQVGMDRSGRQALETGAAEEGVLVDQFIGQAMEHMIGDVRFELRHRFFPPADAAQMRLE